MNTNFVAVFWSQMADEARKAARSIGNQDMKLHVLLIAARYLVMAKRSETKERPIHQGEKPTH